MLLEPNRELGRKLRITGKGRCNVTNDCTPREFIEAIPGDGRFLQSAIHRFSCQDVMAFFEGLGVPLKTERGRRVFPVSDKAGDIAGALARLCHKNGVEILREKAKAIKTGEDGVCAVVTERGEIPCRSAVICTGGLSYPARVPPATATPWRGRWGTRSISAVPAWCRWSLRTGIAARCRAFRSATSRCPRMRTES